MFNIIKNHRGYFTLFLDSLWSKLFFLLFLIASNFTVFATNVTYTITAINTENFSFQDSEGIITNDPTITVVAGDTLTLVLNAGTSHPFWILNPSFPGGSYNSTYNQAGVVNNGGTEITLVWDLTGVAPGTYFYICENHPNMTGTIVVTPLGPDTDGDGVYDVDDLDDDNDGITDLLEGGDDLDTDLDGLENRIDPDSDGDGCNDVVEAGYTDGDSDGIVGVAPYEYTAEGLVKNVTYKAFDDIDDLDANSTKDFLEKGSTLSKTVDPTSVSVLQYSKVTFVGGGSTVDNLGTIVYNWQITSDDGASWYNISTYTTDNPSHPGTYSGATNDTLNIDSVTIAMEGFRYRLYMETPAFKCDGDVTTNDATLSVFKPDFDSDGVPDDVDKDDDNDGIVDTVEGETTDTDNDGSPNSKDLDSDGDGCKDAIEAGWSDEDGDGMVGILPVLVDSDGKVVSIPDGTSAYSSLNDLDGNGVKDYLEAGANATVVSSPADVTKAAGKSATFISKGSSTSGLSYTWQVSTDAGNTFSDIKQPKMIISGGVSANYYRYKYIEIYALEDIPANSGYKVVFHQSPGDSDPKEKELSYAFNKGEYYILAMLNHYTDDFFNISTTGGFTLTNGYKDFNIAGVKKGKVEGWTDLQYQDGNSAFKLVDPDGDVIDSYGEVGTDGSGTPWSFNLGWFHRNDNNYTSVGFDKSQWVVHENIYTTSGYNGKNHTSSPSYPVANFDPTTNNLYSGLTNDTLTINYVQLSMDRYKYRAVIKSTAYLCDNGANTSPAELIVFLDSDNDGVGDVTDLDDDNDGILDTDEGDADDYDNDGIPNRLDLDSDGDGCNDVIEAGFADGDSDGIIGTGTPSVDANGKVSSVSDGYTTPADGDANSVVDFLQPSYAYVVITNPLNTTIDELNDVKLIVDARTNSTYINWATNEPDNNDFRYNVAYEHYNGTWYDNYQNTVSLNFIAEFNTIRNDAITGFTYLTQYQGHSYYYSNSTKNWATAVGDASTAGGYLLVLETSKEDDAILEAFKAAKGNNVYWINFSQDHSSLDYAHPDGGWSWGIIPGNITYQWQIATISGSDTTWADISANTNYSGVTNDTLTISDAPSNFNGNLYRSKVINSSYACQTDLVSSVSKLTVYSDPDEDGIKNSVDLDDDNDGILDTEEGDGDIDGDGIPNRIDLDSDGDGCNDVLEAGFTDADADGIVGTGTPSVGADGKVTGHSYATPTDGNSSGTPDFKEKGFSPVISVDLSTTTVSAVGSSAKISIDVTIDDIPSTSTYSNWGSGEPNNASSSQHVTQMHSGTGFWDDLQYYNNRYYVVEFNSIRSDAITGYTYMTQYNNHSYYISTAKVYHTAAITNSLADGGYLVIIDDDAENTIVKNAVNTVNANNYFWINYTQDTGGSKYYEPAGGWEAGGYPSTVNYQWQLSTDSTSWSDISDAAPYSTSTTKSLSISATPSTMSGYQYRVIVTNPGFVCVVNDTSAVTTLVTRNDFDGDGIEDDSDVDDDNDGILDTQEGNGSTDTDGDGNPDSQDLDSDGDGCYDVDEYFGTETDRDSNSDGIFGGVDPTINADGSVDGVPVSSGIDADGNGTKDFQEAGAAITSVSCPGDLTVIEGKDLDIISTGSAGSTSINYQWQLSLDSGKNWTNTGTDQSDLIITGIGYGKVGTNNDGTPKFIELYAKKDLNLQEYRMRDQLTNGPTYVYSYVMNQINKTLNAGEYMIIYYPSNTSEFSSFFGDTPSNLYSYAVFEDYFYYTMRNGDDSYALEKKIDGVWTYVDRVGDGYDGTGKSHDYDDGWLYRKSGSNPSATFNASDWTACKDCLESTTNAGGSTPFPLKSFTSSITLSQSSDTLKLEDVGTLASGYQFRVIASTPSYVCGENDTSCVVKVTVLPDNDKDGVADINDLDDDNDGILDTDEGSTDNDNDGIINSLDLDSDGDGCYDAVEAGFLDGDNDGILGSAPVTVDSDGKVTSATGYTTPADGDSNGTKDFLEVGSGVSITRQPHVYVAEADDTVKYTVLHTTQGTVTYQWQESRNSGSTWTDLSETTVYNNVTTNILTVNKVTSTMDEYLYRAIIKTPAYACQDSVVTENARLTGSSI